MEGKFFIQLSASAMGDDGVKVYGNSPEVPVVPPAINASS
jgi:hypothetical protein